MPAAAIPAHIEFKDEFPLSASGKVDRKRLANDAEADVVVLHRPSATSSLRLTIQQVWEEVLDRKVADTGATFFDLGGTSLQMIAVHTALQARLNMTFNIAQLFQAPRIQDLETLLSTKDTTQDRVALQRARMLKRRGRS